MTREQKRTIGTFLRYVLLIAVGIIMVYPLIWMVGASFKTNSEIFSSVGFIPKNPVITGYVKGFAGYEGMTLLHFMANTYKIVLPKVIVTLVSATITAYGFARFDFFGKKFSFAVLMSTLFLPQVVLNVPQYILFNELGWLDSYLPLVVPSILAGDTYFVYMLIQFQRGIPICNTLYNQRKSLDSLMQSYGIIGITLWRICGVYGETTVSLRRNCSVPP